MPVWSATRRLIPRSVHYLVEDQPETVADRIKRYASLHSE